MTYDLTPDQLAWREEVRVFLRQHASPELMLETLQIQKPATAAFCNNARHKRRINFVRSHRDTKPQLEQYRAVSFGALHGSAFSFITGHFCPYISC